MTKQERIKSAVDELLLSLVDTKAASDTLLALQAAFLDAQVMVNVKSRDKGPGPVLEWRVRPQALFIDDVALDQSTAEQRLRVVLLHRDESIVHELEKKAMIARDNRLQRNTMLASVKQ